MNIIYIDKRIASDINNNILKYALNIITLFVSDAIRFLDLVYIFIQSHIKISIHCWQDLEYMLKQCHQICVQRFINFALITLCGRFVIRKVFWKQLDLDDYSCEIKFQMEPTNSNRQSCSIGVKLETFVTINRLS